jgi:hypothetical protein
VATRSAEVIAEGSGTNGPSVLQVSIFSLGCSSCRVVSNLIYISYVSHLYLLRPHVHLVNVAFPSWGWGTLLNSGRENLFSNEAHLLLDLKQCDCGCPDDFYQRNIRSGIANWPARCRFPSRILFLAAKCLTKYQFTFKFKFDQASRDVDGTSAKPPLTFWYFSALFNE